MRSSSVLKSQSMLALLNVAKAVVQVDSIDLTRVGLKAACLFNESRTSSRMYRQLIGCEGRGREWNFQRRFHR